MTIISYDIADTKLRTKFSKMLVRNGAIRLQYSVYEFRNTSRLATNLGIEIEKFRKRFSMEDSVMVIPVDENRIVKYGNALHHDQSLIFL